MYGYATDETEEMMPLTISLAHQLNKLAPLLSHSLSLSLSIIIIIISIIIEKYQNAEEMADFHGHVLTLRHR